MEVFISWSGARSKAVAHALHGFLPLVLHYVEPWLSEADIPAGNRWADDVAKKLEAANFGIICVTPENLNAPWVLFEAGALAKSMQESRVIPLLLGLDFGDITGPLAQFQAKKVDRPGVREVVQSINEKADTPVPESRMQELFDLAWPKFETAFAAIPAPSAAARRTPSAPAAPTRPQSEILEDLVSKVSALDARIRESSDATPGEVPKPNFGSTTSSQIANLDKIVRILSGRHHYPSEILALANVFTETMPDVWNLGVEAYDAVVGRDITAGEKLRLFRNAVSLALQDSEAASGLGYSQRTVKLIQRELSAFYARFPFPELQPEGGAAASDQDGEVAPPTEDEPA